MLNGVENSNACSSARDSEPRGFTFNIQLLPAYIGNMSSDQPKTLAYIDDYRSFTALWDVNHKDYTNKMKRNNVLNALVTDYKMGVKEVKNKIKSLRSYFGKEQQM